MEKSEKQYRLATWVGITINLVFVAWYCVEYGKECMSTEKSTNVVVTSKISMDCIAMISGLFLGDALRRIWISYKKQTGLL